MFETFVWSSQLVPFKNKNVTRHFGNAVASFSLKHEVVYLIYQRQDLLSLKLYVRESVAQ